MTKAIVDGVGKQIFINGQEVEIQKDSLFISGADDLDQPLVVHVALVVEDLTIQRETEPVEVPEDAVSNKVAEIIEADRDLVE